MASWSEQYEARKAERLKEEEGKKMNKKLGFGNSECCLESKSSKTINKSNENCVSDNESVEEKVKNGVSATESIRKKVINCLSYHVEKKEVASSSNNETESTVDDTDVRITACSIDPWYSTYESKKAAAVENLKAGNLQSVSGASGFVGKIEGVDHLSKKNEITKIMNKFKQEDKKATGINENDKHSSKLPPKSDLLPSTKVSSSGPPPPPRQLLQLSMPEEPSSPPSDRPARPSVPTPGKYGTPYGGAPSPGPNPSRSFQPPGFVPPTPPASNARRRPWLGSHTADADVGKNAEKDDSIKSLIKSVKADSKLSTSSWQEEYLARKKARLGND